MKKLTKTSIILSAIMLLSACGSKGPIAQTITEEVKKDLEKIRIDPISDASGILTWNDKLIYIDPVGGPALFERIPRPEVVMVTDVHEEQFDLETLESIIVDKTTLIVPQVVAEKLPESMRGETVILKNNESVLRHGLRFVALPMYNLPESDQSLHPKGRGNGYLIEKDGIRVYLAGDTSDTPEMKSLDGIDIALIPMSLPDTMSVEQAAEAVLEFEPRKVYPYRYRGKDGFSDVEKFKQIIQSANEEIEVIQLDWYPEI